MSQAALLQALRESRFFEEATEGELEQIASVARVENYEPGSVLFRSGERLSRIFVIHEGAVSLELAVASYGSKRLHTVGRGELLGWSPLLSHGPMTATARAMTPTQVIAMDAGQVLALCHHDTRLGFALMRRVAMALAQRLDATRLQLLDIFLYELPTGAD